MRGLDSEAAALLSSYNWPGNVRELENIIERAMVLTRSDVLTKDDLAGISGSLQSGPDGDIRPLADVEKQQIEICLNQLDWNIGLSAEKLGIHRNTLRAKIKEYKLSRSD